MVYNIEFKKGLYCYSPGHSQLGISLVYSKYKGATSLEKTSGRIVFKYLYHIISPKYCILNIITI